MLPCLLSGLVKSEIVRLLLAKSCDSNRLNLKSTGSLPGYRRREKLEAGIPAKGDGSTKTAIK